MQTKIIEIHQRNMYCTKCLNNVIRALAKIQHIIALDIDMSDKTIKIEYQDEELNKKEIQTLINTAITTGNVE